MTPPAAWLCKAPRGGAFQKGHYEIIRQSRADPRVTRGGRPHRDDRCVRTHHTLPPRRSNRRVRQSRKPDADDCSHQRQRAISPGADQADDVYPQPEVRSRERTKEGRTRDGLLPHAVFRKTVRYKNRLGQWRMTVRRTKDCEPIKVTTSRRQASRTRRQGCRATSSREAEQLVDDSWTCAGFNFARYRRLFLAESAGTKATRRTSATPASAGANEFARRSRFNTRTPTRGCADQS